MSPPLSIHAPRPGAAHLGIDLVGGLSAVTSARASSPMRVLTPVPRGPCVRVVTSSLGGGLVAGDCTRLELRLGPGTRALVGTQASTKVYRNPGALLTTHVTEARVGSGALLVVAPDPVQPFAGAHYTQSQRFDLDADAGLVLVDALTAGRAARGERWAFDEVRCRNEVWIEGVRLCLDTLLLDRRAGGPAAPHRLGRYNALATLLVVGEPFRQAAASLVAGIESTPVTRRAPWVVSASPLGSGALVRLAGEAAETVALLLRRYLASVTPVLGEHPWSRKW